MQLSQNLEKFYNIGLGCKNLVEKSKGGATLLIERRFSEKPWAPQHSVEQHSRPDFINLFPYVIYECL